MNRNKKLVILMVLTVAASAVATSVPAFGDDIAAYYNHFPNHGIKEHRTLGGFPAEKIAPGGAVAYSGGSSSSSGSSSKPAPQPADTTPAPEPTPTPEPEPQAAPQPADTTPAPEPGPTPEPAPQPADTTPAPQPTPTPEAEPQSEPTPEPESQPEPQPADTTPAPQSEPTLEPTSRDYIDKALAFRDANYDLEVALFKYYNNGEGKKGTTQNNVPLTKGERDELVSRALSNLEVANKLKTDAANNLDSAEAENAAAQDAFAAATAAVSEASKLNNALLAFTSDKTVITDVGEKLDKYYAAIENVATMQITADSIAIALKKANALAEDAAVAGYNNAKEEVGVYLVAAKKAVEDTTEAVAKAKKERDEAYASAGVAGNAELVARDEAQENAIKEAYEERVAQMANNLVEGEYGEYTVAVQNYNDAERLVATQ